MTVDIDAPAIALASQLSSKSRGPLCHRCKRYSQKRIHFSKDTPPILCLTPWPSVEPVKVNQELSLSEGPDKITLKLRGVIYHGQNHFTCRYITKSRQVFYHDGLHGHEYVHDGSMSYITKDDSICHTRDKRAVLFLYSAL